MAGPESLRGAEKAALFLAALGEEASASIVKNLPVAQLAKLGAALRKIEKLDPESERVVLGESRRILRDPKGRDAGGGDLARRILTRALGADQADRFLGDEQEEAARASLASAPASKIAAFLSKEAPLTIAVVLRQLPAKLAAETLAALPEDRRPGALKGIAGAECAPPALVRRISLVLRKHLADPDAGGPAAAEEEDKDAGLLHAVEMLRAMGRAKGREILATIEADDPETATRIKDRLFLFEDLSHLPARSLGEVLRGVDARKLALALKGTEEAIRDKFLGALSERAAQMIREEMEYLGGARVEEIEEAQKEVRDVALQLEAAGTLNLEETDHAPAA
ncbi:MAG: hypothetical protein HY049_04815 [Acidobacteria bacterium]|nr:hypothetical protein [Acidobacteriota bacterium]